MACVCGSSRMMGRRLVALFALVAMMLLASSWLVRADASHNERGSERPSSARSALGARAEIGQFEGVVSGVSTSAAGVGVAGQLGHQRVPLEGTTTWTFVSATKYGGCRLPFGSKRVCGSSGGSYGYDAPQLLRVSRNGEATNTGASSGYSVSKINITEDGLTHVFDRHLADGSLSAGKSLFNENVTVTRLIADAGDVVAPITQRNGNLAYVVDAGRNIGVDRATGLPTRIYTVITRPGGNLVTAFPGRP